MFSQNQKISGRQTFRLLTYDLLGLGTLMIPPFLARDAGTDGVFCIFLGIVAGVLYLKMLGVVLGDMNGSYPAYLEEKMGAFFGKLATCCYGIYFVCLAGYAAYLFTDAVLKHLLREESFYLVLSVVLALTAYGIWSGVEGRARVYEVLFWILLLPFFLILFSSVWDVRTDYWTPVFVTNAAGVWRGTYVVFVFFSMLTLVLFLGSYVQKKKALLKAGKMALFFCGGIFVVLYLLLVGIFGSPALAEMDFPAMIMMSTVQFTGGFLKRTDALMFGIWFFTLYAFLSSTAFYGQSALCHAFFGEKAAGAKKNGCIVAALLAAAALAILFYRDNTSIAVFENIIGYVATPFLVLIPALLAVAVKFTGRGAKRAAALVMLCIFCAPLCGCNTAELEDKNFPIELAVSDIYDFGASFTNEENGGNKLADYSHLKVVVLEQDFYENERAMTAFLELLENKLEVPRNTYVVVAEDAKKIVGLEEKLGQSAGTYIEEMFENVTYIKKMAYPTLGTLYQEKKNRSETLLVPYLVVLDDKPVVDHYMVWKRGQAAGEIDNEMALLSAFTTNEMDEYTLALGSGEQVRLFDIKNEITFGTDKKGKRKVYVNVNCSGEVLYDEDLTAHNKQRLNEAIYSYMNQLARTARLEYRIDLADSFKKLGGGAREWYLDYRDTPQDYEKEVQLVYRGEICWVNF